MKAGYDQAEQEAVFGRNARRFIGFCSNSAHGPFKLDYSMLQESIRLHEASIKPSEIALESVEERA